MANMSYCRFYNTRLDMEDCLEALRNGEISSKEELKSCKRMFSSIMGYFFEEGVDIDEEAFDEWLNDLECEE